MIRFDANTWSGTSDLSFNCFIGAINEVDLFESYFWKKSAYIHQYSYWGEKKLIDNSSLIFSAMWYVSGISIYSECQVCVLWVSYHVMRHAAVIVDSGYVSS